MGVFVTLIVFAMTFLGLRAIFFSKGVAGPIRLATILFAVGVIISVLTSTVYGPPSESVGPLVGSGLIFTGAVVALLYIRGKKKAEPR
jgi:hypothetical protein